MYYNFGMKNEGQPHELNKLQNHELRFNSVVENLGRRRFIKLGIFAALWLAGAMIPGCGCTPEKPDRRFRDRLNDIPGLPGTN